jgi:hypothetical protein
VISARSVSSQPAKFCEEFSPLSCAKKVARVLKQLYFQSHSTAKLNAGCRELAVMKLIKTNTRRQRMLALFLFLLLFLQVALPLAYAQNLGGQPAVNKSVQGQTAAQPEGAFLNLVNWIGNVICPVGAALCIVMAVVSYTHGRGVARWVVAAAGLLMVSGLTRLIEFWISQGSSGVQ